MIRGALFDMDGVLLDSEEYITRAGVMMFREKRFEVKFADFKPFTGMGENRFLGGVAEEFDQADWVISDLSEAPEDCLVW
jgi:beta-phosphoglucomutase-like phosphatase (HAD superfamily)